MGLEILRAFARFSLKQALGISLLLPAAAIQAQPSASVSHWTLADLGIHDTDRPNSPNILGTIALPVRAKPTSTRWAKLMMASLDQPALIHATDGAQALAPLEQVSFVQSAVMHAVRSPSAGYDCSDDGYWAPASETLVRGMGDCFDIAIAKMEALRYLGFETKDLYLTTGRFGPGHASGAGRESVALLVRIGDQFWLMVENSEQLIEANRPDGISAQYTPVVTYGVGSTWVHGRQVNLAALGG
jgi:predicted transglutaminase-like cysteine proteinase